MLTIRGQTITITPLTTREVCSVIESVAVLGKCTPTIKVLLPENFPHLVRAVAVVVRREIPDVTLGEVSAALNPDNLTAVLQALPCVEHPSLAEVYEEHSNVRH